MDYPIWDIAMGGGVLMGLVAITHVIVSHFAIGGGLVIAVTDMDALNTMLTSDEGVAAAAADGVRADTMRVLVEAD